MPSLDPALLRWAVQAAAPGADVVEVRGLRDGGSLWLLRLQLANGDWSGIGEGEGGLDLDRNGLGRGGTPRAVVLRVGGEDDHAPFRTEVAALRLAAEHGIPAPRLLAAELVDDRPVVLVERLAGSSQIPPERPPARLRTLGRVAAALQAVALAPARRCPGATGRSPARTSPPCAASSPPGTCWWRPRSGRPCRRRGRRPCSSTATSGRATPCGRLTPSSGWSTGTARAPARPGSTSARSDAFLRAALDRLDAGDG